MPLQYDEAPEVAASVSPEVHHPPTGPEFNPYAFHHQQQHIGASPVKPDVSPVQPGGGYVLPAYGTSGYGTPNAPGSYYGHGQPSGYAPIAPPSPGRQSKARTICGCTVVVFILSMIIALLSAAVVGLAAGTGVEASRASDAESSLAALKASATSTAPSSTSTSDDYSALDRNCSSNPSGTTGDTYASTFFTESQYTIYCNRDTPNAPLSSLFVANLDDCMDACSSWSYYAPSDFPNGTATNQTCSGVSFIPAWTNRTTAVAGTAPGNCYLKPGPQNETSLYTPNNGQETHAAIIVDS
ncbi:hypothetical protein PFICI_04819 [Pestalotiopsis fici W106-1]|uniref:Apple domain-containing protein n=1 Tax=Pestalotiopsis fici (strain W106-1 / CGMCC3.15140) TaxID=1229662 RepID=W3XA06_PESFW|nr:uncharacterized protein PFICI_04819 [Pestalotiopsis fici W106-1]ETS82943.1 hypothetical protein PFICI_04819 [Pestalotiopsis fici W106-1]